MQISASANASVFAQQKSSSSMPMTNNQKTEQMRFVVGDELVEMIGRKVLGGDDQIAYWESQGFSITQETIERAFQAFNEASSASFKIYQETGRHMDFTLDRYGIVMASQQVPNWFTKEADNMRQSTMASARESFDQGKLFHLIENKNLRTEIGEIIDFKA